jgi:acylglycerol lipase
MLMTSAALARHPSAGLWPGRAALAADAATAAQILRRLYPGIPLYLLGESMGGAVAVVALTGGSGTQIPDVNGVILTAPAVWGRPTMDLLPRLALWAGVRLMPGLTLTGRGLKLKPSDNIEMLRALGKDPLVIHATRIDTIYGLVDLMDAALASGARLDTPMFVMHGGRDEIVPRAPIRRFVDGLPAEPMRRRKLAWYENGYRDRGCCQLGAETRRTIALRCRQDRCRSLFAGRRPPITGRPLTRCTSGRSCSCWSC